ncbi:MAG: hypothetical protein AB7L09_24650 [Nitrospira sp.]
MNFDLADALVTTGVLLLAIAIFAAFGVIAIIAYVGTLCLVLGVVLARRDRNKE